MLIEEKQLQYWVDNFYGYGSWGARIWFIAYEEDGGDTPEEVGEKFNYFSNKHSSATQPTLCNLRELYSKVSFHIEGPREELFSNLFEYRFGSHAKPHGIWKNLIAFVHGYQNKKLPDLMGYQIESFSTSSAKEAWIKLYPLPSTHNHAWYYSWLDMPQFDFLKSRSRYENHMYDKRMSTLLQKIDIHKPEVVLMYGMDNINTLKKSVQTFFPEAKFTTVKAIKQQIPQHHYATFRNTTLLITTQTPALHHNRIETGFDWYELGRRVNS